MLLVPRIYLCTDCVFDFIEYFFFHPILVLYKQRLVQDELSLRGNAKPSRRHDFFDDTRSIYNSIIFALESQYANTINNYTNNVNNAERSHGCCITACYWHTRANSQQRFFNAFRSLSPNVARHFIGYSFWSPSKKKLTELAKNLTADQIR